MTDTSLETLTKLYESGVRFNISIPDVHSWPERPCTPHQVLLYLEDKVAFYASMHGVTKAEYQEWEADDFCVICSATTKRGKPCRQIALGGFQVSPQTWVELQGAYCSVHEGESGGSPVRPTTSH